MGAGPIILSQITQSSKHKHFSDSHRQQRRRVSKVLLDGLYDSDSPLSKLVGPRREIMGEIIWEKMLVRKWQAYPYQPEKDLRVIPGRSYAKVESAEPLNL